MRRVLISSSQFKLSAQGFDAATATGSGLIFDGFGGYAYNGAYLVGSVPAASMMATTYQGNAAWQYVVNFGKTFPSPPQCLVALNDPTHSGGFILTYLNSTGDGNNFVQLYVSVTTTLLTVGIAYLGSYFPSKLGFNYGIMQV